MSLINSEPALIVAFVEAVLALAIGFGLALTGAQVALILAVVTSGLALVVRSKVTPIEVKDAEA